MHAIVVDESAAERPLGWQEVPDPAAAAGEVLVAVHATAVNRADLMQRAGNYPPPPGASPYLGLEVAGTIAVLGADVTDWQVGDRVCAIVTGGGYAELAAVPAATLMRIPAGMGFTDAAAIPEVFLTAYVNLFQEGGLAAGERLLVHGGASGVGTAAIQLARQAGAWIAVTARDERKLAVCRELGAQLGIDHTACDFQEELESNGGGVDVVLDMVGADYLERNLAVLRPRGRLVVISVLSGAGGQIDLRALLVRRLRLIGST